MGSSGGHDDGDCPYPFDHTSIIRTAFDLLIGDKDVHLTERDKVAPSFTVALDLPGPTNKGPEEIIVPDYNAVPMKHKHCCHSAPFLKTLVDEDHNGIDDSNQLQGKVKTRLMEILGL